MKIMNKLILFSLLFIFLLGCIHNNSYEVVSSIRPIYLIAREFTNNTTYVIPTNVNPHLYEPKPSSFELINNARIYVEVGNHFEDWDNKKGNITMSDYTNSTNPHIWLNPDVVKQTAKKLGNLLNKQNQYTIFEKKLNEVDTRIKRESKNKTIIVLSYVPFLHEFTSYFNFTEIDITQNTEPSLNRIEQIKAYIKEYNIKCIFVPSQINGDVVRNIAKETNITVVEIDPMASNYTDYPSFMLDIWRSIKECQ